MTKNLLIYLAREETRKLIKYCKDPEWKLGWRNSYKTKTEGYLQALSDMALELGYMETRSIINEIKRELIYLNTYTGKYER